MAKVKKRKAKKFLAKTKIVFEFWISSFYVYSELSRKFLLLDILAQLVREINKSIVCFSSLFLFIEEFGLDFFDFFL